MVKDFEKNINFSSPDFSFTDEAFDLIIECRKAIMYSFAIGILNSF